jgi:hypothetical protein
VSHFANIAPSQHCTVATGYACVEVLSRCHTSRIPDDLEAAMKVRGLRISLFLAMGICVGCGLLGAYHLHAQQQQRSQINAFMLRKLDLAKDMLEGLTTDNMDKVTQSAQGLSTLSIESAWNVYTTEEYLDMSEDFRHSLSIVKNGAKSGNPDRATLGYINMTVQCVECHRFLKGKK